MNHAIFWQLIARMGSDLQPARLALALTPLAGHHFLAFGWYLRNAAAALDGPAHRYFASAAHQHALPVRSPRLEPSTPVGDGPPGLRAVQMTVVALGHDTWSAVVATPELLEASWPCALGREVEALSVREPFNRHDAFVAAA